MANNIRIRASVEDKASGPIDNIRDRFDRLRAQGAKGFGIGVGAAVTAGALSMVGTAISSVTSYLGEAVTAARQETVGIAALNASLKANSASYKGNTDAIEETIKERMALGFADDEQRESLAFLTAVTKDHNKALDLQRGAMDLARLKGIDLKTAGELMGKVYGGNIGILARYGIQLEKGTSATEALGAIQRMSAGQAEAWADTEEGAAATAALAFGELAEDVGRLLLPALTELAKFARDVLVPALSVVVEVIGTVAGAVSTAAGVIGDAVGWMVDTVTGGAKEIPKAAEAGFSELPVIADRGMTEMRAAMAAGGVLVEREFERIASEPVNIMNRQLQPIRDAAFQSQVSYAKGLLDGQNQPLVQMEALVQLQAEALDRGTETARLMGQLHSTELAAGMASTIGEVRAQAEATRLAIVNRLATLGVDASSWGYGIGASLASGLDGGYGVVINAAGRLARAVRGQIGINSEPSDPSSALRGITKWGGNIATTMAEGMIGKLGTVKGAAASVAAGLVPSVSSPQLAFAGEGAASGAPQTVVFQVDGRTLAEVVIPWASRLQPAGASVVLPRGT